MVARHLRRDLDYRRGARAGLAGTYAVIVLAVTLLGIELIVWGLFRLVGALTFGEAGGGARTLWAILGILSLLIGFYAIRHIVITVLSLGLLLGFFWLVDGIGLLVSAVEHRDMRGRGWSIFSGILGIIAGLVLLVWPALSILTFAILAGIWLIVVGVMQISVAVQAPPPGLNAFVGAAHQGRPPRGERGGELPDGVGVRDRGQHVTAGVHRSQAAADGPGQGVVSVERRRDHVDHAVYHEFPALADGVIVTLTLPDWPGLTTTGVPVGAVSVKPGAYGSPAADSRSRPYPAAGWWRSRSACSCPPARPHR